MIILLIRGHDGAWPSSWNYLIIWRDALRCVRHYYEPSVQVAPCNMKAAALATAEGYFYNVPI